MKTKRNVSYQLLQIQQSLPKNDQAKLIKLGSIDNHIKKALQAYNNALPNAKQMRQDQIHEWSEAAAKRGDKTEAQHYKSMAHAEDSRETFRILQNTIKPQDRSGIKSIDIPATDEQGCTLVDNNGKEIMKTVKQPDTSRRTTDQQEQTTLWTSSRNTIHRRQHNQHLRHRRRR